MSDSHSPGADSAGQTFSGRSLASTGFVADDGSVSEGLAAALESPTDETGLMAALSRARLLVPIVAALSEVDDSGDLPVENRPAEGRRSGPASSAGTTTEAPHKNTDMAVVTLESPTGERALPVFTDLAAMAAWDPAARPSPVHADRAAQAAITERCDVMVLDVATRSLVLRPSMVWALAQRQTWKPPHLDDHVRQAVSRSVVDETDIAAVHCEAGAAPGELRVVLTVYPGLTQPELQALARRVGEQIATDGETRARIDGLTFSIVSAAS